MVWGAGTGVFNLTYSSGLPADSIITSQNKSRVFPSFSNRATFLTSSVPSPSTDTFSPASSPSSPPSEIFLPYLPMTNFIRTPPLPPIPLRDLSWSFPDCLNFDALDFLSFAFVLSGIKPAQHCLPFSFSSLTLMFLEHLVWHACLAGEGASPRRGAEIAISHV